MAQDAVIDEIWQLLRETDAILKRTAEEAARRAEEAAERDREAAGRAAEADRRAAEADRRAAEADRRAAEADQDAAEAKRRSEKIDRQLDAVGRRLDATGAYLKEVGKRVDDLTGKWGKFVEGIIAPAAPRLFQERNIPVDGVNQRMVRRRQGRHMEIDLLAVNDGHVVAIEVKSTLKVEDVRDHLARLAEFKTFFPEYADQIVHGAVAGIVIEESASLFAYRQGLFVIGQSGDTAMILNDAAFTPKAW